MIPRPPRPTRTDTLLPYTTRVRSGRARRSRYRHRHAHSSLWCCNLARGLSTRADRLEGWGRLREGAESYAKLAQIAGARSYLLLPSTVAPERRRLSSIRRWLRILKVSGPTRRYSMKPRERQNRRSEEHTSELQSLMRNSYAVFCLKTKQKQT